MPPAIIAGAIAGAGAIGSAVISSKATKKASTAATQAAADNTALARETRDIITGQVQPWVQPGAAATNRLAERLGLSVGTPTGQVSTTNTNALAPYAAGGYAPSVANSGGGSRATYAPETFGKQPTPDGGFAGTSPLEGAASGNPLAPVAAGGQPDFAAYYAANPDLAADPSLAGFNPGDLTGDGKVDNADRGAWHYQNYGQDEGRDLPQGAAPTPAPAGPAGPALPYGVRPEDAQAPTFDPRAEAVRPASGGAAPTYDYSLASFEASPDYEFRQKEAARGLNSYYGARGGLKSGSAIKAILERASNLAAGEYGAFFNRQFSREQADRNQFNTDTARTDTNFNIDTARGDARYDSDRGFNYGKWYDTRNFNTGRYDKETSDLFNLSGQGLAGVGTIAGANQNALGVIANSNNQRADAVGSAAIAGANSTNNLIGQGLQAVGTYYGLQGGGKSLTSGNPLRSI